ncbi:MAG: hypothetical protein SVW77_02685 [Candidatus Nanohaloarchaea archaeon]|nr:hypothetical protein [Candidatus Nanohaloarchaea archaeon]
MRRGLGRMGIIIIIGLVVASIAAVLMIGGFGGVWDSATSLVTDLFGQAEDQTTIPDLGIFLAAARRRR